MKKRVIVIAACIVIVCLLSVMLFSLGSKGDIGPCTEYKCNVKNFRLATTIEISKDGNYFSKVTGDLFKFVTDPLTMIDYQGNKIAYAGDVYHLIAQDSHAIFVNEEVSVEMVGKVEVFGEEYDIYDKDGKKLANVKFNELNTDGEMYDTDGKLIADFNSRVFFNDFDVRITENCKLDEKTVLMIFCSYYSDYSADSK